MDIEDGLVLLLSFVACIRAKQERTRDHPQTEDRPNNPLLAFACWPFKCTNGPYQPSIQLQKETMNDTSDNKGIQAKVVSSENIDGLFQIVDDSAKSLDDGSDTATVTKLVCDVVKLKQKQATTEKHLVNVDKNVDSLEGDHVKLRNENK
jgi:hypothetical protein